MENEFGRYCIKVFGIVQGIGYRPFIYKTAKSLNVHGWVSNNDSSVVMDIEGSVEDLKEFLLRIIKNPPKLARIEKTKIEKKHIIGYVDFRIKNSTSSGERLKFLIPDVATCEKCVEDIFDKNSKRYRYSFTNCTDCGPRYSIMKRLPYDRVNTTMNNFKMCSYCKSEYGNPDTRRFHAQPNCCNECGPKLMITDSRGERVECKDEIKESIRLLKEGKIIAIKGIGGFHIACNAYDKEAVSKIRVRKVRPHKPLAIMVKDIQMAKEICFISDKEEASLTSSKRPIVILNKKLNSNLPNNIAPNVNKLGVMLPYTPVHYLLFSEGLEALVMTSGNISGCPIEYENSKSLKNLKDVADYFLFHNREINMPVDDSVVKVIKEAEVVTRLGRGYAPLSMVKDIKNKIFSTGSEMKNTFAFSTDGIVYGSQYLGDLKNLDSFNEYKKSTEKLSQILQFKPNVIARDMHPSYMSSIHGEKQEGIKVKIQHHHAHMASCMLEHNLYDKVIGVIYDGTGLGLDNNIWGGEFLIGDRRFFKRVGSFKYVKIQGGDFAQKHIWRIGVSYLNSLDNSKLKNWGLDRIKKLSKKDVGLTCKLLDNDINCYKSSSIGRLFDGVAALLGIREEISYDGQGAIELEAIAAKDVSDYYNYEIDGEENIIINYSNIFEGILKDIKENVNSSIISAKFHNTIIELTLNIVCKLGNKYGLDKVVLSGGVFENEYLLTNLINKLTEKSFQAYYNKIIPINDSGISFGQVAICDEILE